MVRFGPVGPVLVRRHILLILLEYILNLWLRASYLTGMYELLEAYGGRALADNVFGPSAITPARVANPYRAIDYRSAAAVFDSILLNVDSLEDFCRLNDELKLVNPWGLAEVFAGQGRSGTLLEYWARLQSMTRLMIGQWKSSLHDDGETISMVSDWSHHPGVGLSTVGACFSAHRIKTIFGLTPLSMRMPYQAGQSMQARLESEFPGVEIKFEHPLQEISYLRSEVLAAPPIPVIPGPRVTHRDLLETYYPENRRQAAVSVLEFLQKAISAGQEPELEAVASRLAISPRELQRALASGGLTMRSVVERIRVSMAEVKLAETSDSILEIALGAGYSSHQALTKVFKRWRGLAPAEYRHYVRQNRPASDDPAQGIRNRTNGKSRMVQR
jgi:AraC-like DNA-binding protein